MAATDKGLIGSNQSYFMALHWALHLGIHVARFFWIAIVVVFACCLGAYLRHQKISADELASVKYLEPKRVTDDAASQMTGDIISNLNQPPVRLAACLVAQLVLLHAIKFGLSPVTLPCHRNDTPSNLHKI